MSQPTGNPTAEGRQRQLYISRRVIMEMMSASWFGRNIPRLYALPDDAYVSSVHYDERRRSFCFTIDSMEFEPVPDGSLIPVIMDPAASVIDPFPAWLEPSRA